MVTHVVTVILGVCIFTSAGMVHVITVILGVCLCVCAHMCLDGAQTCGPLLLQPQQRVIR